MLTFAGLRPREGERVQWQDYTFKTNELYVREGKTLARHIILEPAAQDWIKFHRENTPQGEPFVKLKSLENRNKAIRKAVFNGEWIQDGLRHGFATYFKAKTKSVAEVADYMGIRHCDSRVRESLDDGTTVAWLKRWRLDFN